MNEKLDHATEVETYLQSELAREDVRALLARPTGSVWMPGGAPAPCAWKTKPAGCWVGAEFAMEGHGAFHVYCRPEGDRFIVSDLGDGVRDLRLRAGMAEIPEQISRALMRLAPDGASMDCAAEFVWTVRTAAVELPDAICRVLLASYRVANLPGR